MRADHHRAEDRVATRLGQYLDEAVRLALGHRTLQFVHIEQRQLERHTLLAGAGFVQAHAGHLRLGIGGPRHDRIGGFGAVERGEQRAVARLHALKSGGVGELVWPRHIARGINMRQRRLQPAVMRDRAIAIDADILQPISREPRLAPDADEQRVIGDLLLAIRPRGDQCAACGILHEARRLMPGEHAHAVRLQLRLHQRRSIGIFLAEQPIGLFHQRHLRSESLIALGQLAADRPAADNGEARWRGGERGHRVPQRLAGQIIALLDALDRRDDRLGAGSDHEMACGEALRAAFVEIDLHRPRIDEAGIAADHIDAISRKRLHAVMRRDIGDHAFDARHHAREINARRGIRQAETLGIAHYRGGAGALDQRLAGHATGVEAIAAHLSRFDQRYLGARLGR